MRTVVRTVVALAIVVSGLRPMGDLGLGSAGEGTAHASAADGSRVSVVANRPGNDVGDETPVEGSRSRGHSRDSKAAHDAAAANPDGIDWATAATDALGDPAASPCLDLDTPVPCAAPSQAKPTTRSTGPRIPTLTDIASFRPTAPTLAMEPKKFGIVGRPTNFIVTAPAQTLTGTLFDEPVTVRFAPALYRFDYGDGTTQTTSAPGSSWKAGRGKPMFAPTATSHTYRRKALVIARVTVAYTAQVSFAGSADWYDIDGYVTADAPGRRFQLYIARTLLVEHTCDEDPRGPGCPNSGG